MLEHTLAAAFDPAMSAALAIAVAALTGAAWLAGQADPKLAPRTVKVDD